MVPAGRWRLSPHWRRRCSLRSTFVFRRIICRCRTVMRKARMTGGAYTMTMAYLTAWKGPVLAEEDPYGDGYSPEGLSPRKHVQEIQILRDRASIKEAVQAHGAVQTSLYRMCSRITVPFIIMKERLLTVTRRRKRRITIFSSSAGTTIFRLPVLPTMSRKTGPISVRTAGEPLMGKTESFTFPMRIPISRAMRWPIQGWKSRIITIRSISRTF